MTAPQATTRNVFGSVEYSSRKEAAVEFLGLCAAGQPREAFETFTGPTFVHHNPYFESDAESLVVGIEKNTAENPEKKLEVLRVLEDSDMVARSRPRPASA